VYDSGVALVEAISACARAEAATAGRRLAAIAELASRRCGTELAASRERWACDAWDSCAAEVAAELTISHRAASGLMHQGLDLRDRFPAVGALLASGAITVRVATTVTWRGALIEDPELLARVDAEIAEAATRFGALSEQKLSDAIDTCINTHDPDAVRRFQSAAKGLDVRFGKPDDETGTRSIYGLVKITDAELLDRRADALARSVCPDDPRTHGERRTEALGIIAVKGEVLPCRCGKPDCPAAGTDPRAEHLVIHVITNNQGDQDDPDRPEDNGPDDSGPDDNGPDHNGPDPGEDPDDSGPDDHGAGPDDRGPDHGAGPDDNGPDDSGPDDHSPDHSAGPDDNGPDDSAGPDDGAGPDGAGPQGRGQAAAPARPPMPCAGTAVIAGGGVIPAPLLAELRAMGALIAPVLNPVDLTAVPGYRPSSALARFVRTRDTTCCFPGCHRRAEYCDVDHTIPYAAGGLTHAGNLKCLCRKHHLLKTFWVGRGGWSDEQLPDGTIVWTTPAGRRKHVPPGSRVLFPDWNTTTPTPATPQWAPPRTPGRELTMPLRARTRAQQQSHNIKAERARNHQADLANPPPY
jgi:hypothetical protein